MDSRREQEGTVGIMRVYGEARWSTREPGGVEGFTLGTAADTPV